MTKKAMRGLAKRTEASNRAFAKMTRRSLSTAICRARNEYDDERDGDFDDYLACHILAALDAWAAS